MARYSCVQRKFYCENKDCCHTEPYSLWSNQTDDYEETEVNEKRVLLWKKDRCPKCGGRMIWDFPVYSSICGYNPKMCDFNPDGTPGKLHWKRNTDFRKSARIYMGIENPY